MSFTEFAFEGNSLIICRTGYTGETGYELVVPTPQATALWDLLATEISAISGSICGLGARDTLRTEMGYPLHGHELSLEISPVEASATWAVDFEKKNFIGKVALHAQKESGTHRRLRGLKVQERGIPRAEMNVLSDGKVVGKVTSGTFSPTLKGGIALALCEQSVKLGAVVTIDVRGRECAAEVVKLPFVPSHVK
jgi:aminomethyltransferase